MVFENGLHFRSVVPEFLAAYCWPWLALSNPILGVISSPPRWKVWAILPSIIEQAMEQPLKEVLPRWCPQDTSQPRKGHGKEEAEASTQIWSCFFPLPGSPESASRSYQAGFTPCLSILWVPDFLPVNSPLLKMISFDFQWLQPRPVADSGTNRIVKDSSNQVDLTVSISGGSAANISGSVALMLIEPKTLHSDIMNWIKWFPRERSGQNLEWEQHPEKV